MNLETLDIAILAIYAVGIFVLAQWVSREKGTHRRMRKTTSWPVARCPGGPSAPR